MNFKKRVNGSWTDTPHYIHNTSTDTITTTPADIYANDTTATVGLKGDMSQTGTPTPTTPIQPSECGERTENLFDYQTMAVSKTNKYLNKTGELLTDNSWNVSDYIPCNGTEFTISKIGGGSPAICLYDDNKNFVAGKNYNTPYGAQTKTTISISSTTNAKYIRFSYNTATFSDDLSKLLITEGIYTSQTIPEYEPYGYKIPILCSNQTTNIYLGETQSIRAVKKLVLTGEESGWKKYDQNASSWLYFLPITNGAIINVVCSHAPYTANIPQSTMVGVRLTNSLAFVLLNLGSVIGTNTIDDFKAYLAQQYAAGTPVCVWYVLAEPTTGIVNEPIRKIGDYADEVSGISIPTIAGANTLSVDTTLQPSEVTINYKGWHPVADVHEAENGQWD